MKTKKPKKRKEHKMRNLIIQLVAAFVALVHTDSDNVAQIATLKGQIADLQAQLKTSVQLTDADVAQINSAVNQIAAVVPPTPADVQAVASVAPAPNQSASSLPATVSAATPPAVQAAATTAPSTAS